MHFLIKLQLVVSVLSSSIAGIVRSITGNGIQLCPYRCWHFCTLVQYQYGQDSLPALACYYARTSIDIVARWFITSMGIVHYQYWHSIVLVPVLAFLNFCSVPVWAHSTLPALSFYNGACTGIDISAPWFSTSIGTYHYRNWHSKMVPLPVLALLHIGSVLV
jgi:hypothetical protein